MGREPRPFVITLTPQEAAEMLAPSGAGGHQQFHEEIRSQLQNGNLSVQLGDSQLGKVIRYMTQYRSGGFQGRLQKAFRRSLIELLSGS